VLAEFQVPADSYQLAFFDNELWVGNFQNLYGISTNGQYRASYAFPPGGQVRGLGSSGGSLLAEASSDSSNDVIETLVIDGTDVTAGTSIPTPRQADQSASFCCIHDLSPDGANIWWTDGNDAFLLEPNGAVVEHFAQAQQITALEWDGRRLWLAYWDGDSSIIEVANHSGQVATSFELPNISRLSALAWGGGSLWALGQLNTANPPGGNPFAVFRLDASKADSPAVRQLTVTEPTTQGGVVTSAPGGIRCATKCVSTFPLGTTVALTAKPAKGYDFGGWKGACKPAAAMTCNVVLSDTSTITASFRPEVTVTRSGGGTVLAPPRINCGSNCVMSVTTGARVALTADPSADSYFAGWGGACSDHDLTCILKVRSPIAVVAPFHPLSDLEISVVQLEGIACSRAAVSPSMSYGTGIILGGRFIATVDHVVATLQEIDVVEHGTVVAHATIIGQDPDRDLALLRTDRPIPNATKQAVTLSSQPAEVNEPVAAIGYTPDAPPNVTLTAITRTNVPARVANVPGLRRLGLLELNEPLNPGNSGGLLVSSETGEVVGLVDMRSTTGAGTGYAVSATVAKPLFAAWSHAPQPPPVIRCR
jgi:S1-C subfamily serine protease